MHMHGSVVSCWSLGGNATAGVQCLGGRVTAMVMVAVVVVITFVTVGRSALTL